MEYRIFYVVKSENQFEKINSIKEICRYKTYFKDKTIVYYYQKLPRKVLEEYPYAKYKDILQSNYKEIKCINQFLKIIKENL